MDKRQKAFKNALYSVFEGFFFEAKFEKRNLRRRLLSEGGHFFKKW